MKKRLVYLFSVVFFVFLGLLQLGLKPQKVEAAYGILHPYSTPVATRGNWYYLDRDSKGTQRFILLKLRPMLLIKINYMFLHKSILRNMSIMLLRRNVINLLRKLRIFMLATIIKKASMSIIGLV